MLKTVGDIYWNSMNYLYSFFVNIKLFQNKKVKFLLNAKETALLLPVIME